MRQLIDVSMWKTVNITVYTTTATTLAPAGSFNHCGGMRKM